MKKIVFSLLLSCLFISANAQQFNFRKSDGTPINNGDVLAYGTTGTYLNFRVTNTGSVPLDIKIKCIGLTNATGNQFELCYGGSCYDNINLNEVYPEYENILAPGASNPSQGDHFVNYNAGNGNAMDYQFSVYALGYESQAITFTYRFDPQLGVNDLASDWKGIQLESTIISSTISFQAEQKGKIELVNINGQKVFSKQFESGTNQMDVNSISSGIYFATFTNAENKTAQFKLIKS
ncbi:MAG: T9SS type A sorting domain-containing protein [Flavobacteriales bacterium]|nr:T9SS type A sorting domain-containing protein [Flavobacteriales bacterium]